MDERAQANTSIPAANATMLRVSSSAIKYFFLGFIILGRITFLLNELR